MIIITVNLQPRHPYNHRNGRLCRMQPWPSLNASTLNLRLLAITAHHACADRLDAILGLPLGFAADDAHDDGDPPVKEEERMMPFILQSLVVAMLGER